MIVLGVILILGLGAQYRHSLDDRDRRLDHRGKNHADPKGVVDLRLCGRSDCHLSWLA